MHIDTYIIPFVLEQSSWRRLQSRSANIIVHQTAVKSAVVIIIVIIVLQRRTGDMKQVKAIVE